RSITEPATSPSQPAAPRGASAPNGKSSKRRADATTRILSEYERLDVLAPHVAKDARDLAHRRVGADRVEDERQEVFAPAGGFFHPRERCAVRLRIALFPDGAHALDLVALDLRIDRHDRHRRCVLDELVRPDDDALFFLDLELVGVRRALDLAL